MADIHMFQVFIMLYIIIPSSIQAWTGKSKTSVIGSSNNHDQDFTCNKSIDIVIIIDSSGSAQKHWNDTIDNSEIFQSYFNISDKMIRVGIVDSSAVSNVYKHLDSNNSNEEAYQLLESLRTSPQNGKTSIGTGLQMAMKLFESASPIRTESKKVILIFTDKQFSKYDKTTDEYIHLFITEDITLHHCHVDQNYTIEKVNDEHISSGVPSNIDTVEKYPMLTNHSQINDSMIKLLIGNDNKSHFHGRRAKIIYGAGFKLSPKDYASHESMIHTVTDKIGSLYSHNYIRKLHGIPPLIWDDDLAYDASDFAYQLADENNGIRHSDMKGYGENVYTYTGSNSYIHSYQAVLSWYSPIKNHNFKKTIIDWASGAATQIIWRESTQLGVGISYRPDTKTTYIVARYKPGGNRYFHFKKNILKPIAGLPPRIPQLKELIPLKQFPKINSASTQAGHHYPMKENLSLIGKEKTSYFFRRQNNTKSFNLNSEDDTLHENMIHVVTDRVGSLYSHNLVRKLHGVPPLIWDGDLAYGASAFAYQLADENNGIRHSDMKGYGENVYTYTGSNSYIHSYQAVLSWYAPIAKYDYDKPRFGWESGTATQMIWKGSTRLGVGISYRPDTKTTYIVSQYKPGGNIYFHFKENVLKPIAGLPPRIPKLEELIPPSPFTKAYDATSQSGNEPTTTDVNTIKSFVEQLCQEPSIDTDGHTEEWSSAPPKQ